MRGPAFVTKSLLPRPMDCNCCSLRTRLATFMASVTALPSQARQSPHIRSLAPRSEDNRWTAYGKIARSEFRDLNVGSALHIVTTLSACVPGGMRERTYPKPFRIRKVPPPVTREAGWGNPSPVARWQVFNAASSGKCGFRRAYTVEGCSSVRSLSGSLLETLRCAHLKIARQPDSHLFLQDDPKVRVSEAVCNDG